MPRIYPEHGLKVGEIVAQSKAMRSMTNLGIVIKILPNYISPAIGTYTETAHRCAKIRWKRPMKVEYGESIQMILYGETIPDGHKLQETHEYQQNIVSLKALIKEYRDKAADIKGFLDNAEIT